MADGDYIKSGTSLDWNKGLKPGTLHLVKLIDDEDAGTNNGVWVNVAGAVEMAASIVSADSPNHTVQLRGYLPSSPTDVPAASEHGFQIGNDQTITGAGNVDLAPLAGGQTIFYIKARVSAYVAGSVSVYLAVRY